MKKGLLLIGLFSMAIHVMAQVNAPCATGTVSENKTICTGTSPGVLSISGQTAGATLQWEYSTDNVAYTNVTGGGTASITPGSLSTTTYYRVKVTAGGCDDAYSNVITITVQQPPTAPTNFTGSNEVCFGSTATLTTAGGNTGSGAVYEWGWGNQIGVNPIITTTPNSWETAGLTADTTFWVRRVGNTACTVATAGVIKQITVKPKPLVAITNPIELCQLPGQKITITNQTEGQLPLEIKYSYGSVPGPASTIILEGTSEINLDLSEADDIATFTILSYGFIDEPKCLNESNLPVVFDVKPRPAVSDITHSITSVLGNELCQGYGSVAFEVTASSNVNWLASYSINDDLIAQNINQNSYNAIVDSAAVHSFVVDSIWYGAGLSCGHNPSLYNTNPASFSEVITIKPTPPAVQFVPGTPSLVQYCAYTFQMHGDSAALVNDLNQWVSNEQNFNIKWKSINDNGAENLTNVPLVNGANYFPVFEDNGCPSKLNSSSLPLTVYLLPLPDASQSNLIVPSQVCSGNPFDIWFNPSENITHYSISDIDFQGHLSSHNLLSAVDYANAAGSNFLITNSASSAETLSANVYAKNKNVSEVNPVTCWSQPFPISIQVNPNASFNPPTAQFESCANGPDFTINPGWNQVGEASWEEPLNFPVPVQIDATTKIISVNMNGQEIQPGEYPIKISGGYPGSNCMVDTTFYIHIYPTPSVTTRILDVDDSICHNEYVNVEVVDPDPNVSYTWSCTNCEADSFEGSHFVTRYFNVANPEETGSDISAEYTLNAEDSSTNLGCLNSKTTPVTIAAGMASCPEGIDFFRPNGLSLVDMPARYFQWYERSTDGNLTAITGATDQTYFPPQQLNDCDNSKYVVASSLYPDKCWSTTVNCFEDFGLRVCKEDGSKSNLQKVNFLLYPNPTQGFDVVLENISQDLKGNYHIELYDVRGKSLMKQHVEIERPMQISLKLPEVKPGVYIFRISGNKFNEAFKLMIN